LLDSVWCAHCDGILRRYIRSHGTYFTAFTDDIIREVDEYHGTDLRTEAPSWDEHVRSRAYELDDTRRLWQRSHAVESSRTYVCETCGLELPRVSCHPDVVRKHGSPPKCCRTCHYVICKCERLGEDVNSRIPGLMANLERPRACDMCGASFQIEHDIFAYRAQDWDGVDYFYANLFAQVCPKCFGGAFRDWGRRGSQKLRLKRLYEFASFIGKPPTQDFANLLYLFRDAGSILEMLTMLRKLRNADGYKAEFGSFFKALVCAGVLPEGSRRLVIGTMVLAEDGHLCFSLPEKAIDDFLFREGELRDASRLGVAWGRREGVRRVLRPDGESRLRPES
jgi:hypothetical protein